MSNYCPFRKVLSIVEPILTKLQALADPTRFAIFECIRCCGGESVYDTETGQCDGGCGEIGGTEVRCVVPCSPSSMSRHFSALREAGLIVTERRGREIYARVERGALASLSAFFGPEYACCEVSSKRKGGPNMPDIKECPCCPGGTCTCPEGCTNCGCC